MDVAAEVMLTPREEASHLKVDLIAKMDNKAKKLNQKTTMARGERNHIKFLKPVKEKLPVKFAKTKIMGLLIAGTGMIILTSHKIFHRLLLLLL